MFCHNRKDLKTEGSSKTWKMKSGKWCGIEKMKTGSMVKCSTLKEAELIPDSAVPYTLPESRCNSSNRQTSKFESGRDLTHLTTCVRQRTLKKRPKTSRSVREVEPQLVSQREELVAYIFVCVCSQCCRFRLRRGKNSVSISECSEHSQQIVLNGAIPQWGNTHTQAWHAVRKVCWTLCMPYVWVYIAVWTHIMDCFSHL